VNELAFEIEVQVDFSDHDRALPDLDRLVDGVETAVLTTLRQQAVTPPAGVTLLLSGDERLQQLNRDFRQEDKPTDVLSFPAGEALPGLTEPDPYLGDIAISVPYAQRQADKQGHSLLAELQLLAIHGTLHLLGYDHGDPSEKAEMWEAQTAVLLELGIAHIVATEN
jgi:probable rRNA maturation factor